MGVLLGVLLVLSRLLSDFEETQMYQQWLRIRDALSEPLGRTLIIIVSAAISWWATRLVENVSKIKKDASAIERQAKKDYNKWKKSVAAKNEERKTELCRAFQEFGNTLGISFKTPFRKTDRQSQRLGRQPEERTKASKDIRIWSIVSTLRTGRRSISVRMRRAVNAFIAIFLLVYLFQDVGSTPPIPTIHTESVIGFPVLFDRAHVGESPDVTFSENSSGIKLENGHKEQLRALTELLNSIARPGLEINLMVIGYASHTPISVGGFKRYNPNLEVANLRAEVVAKFLNKVHTEVRAQVLERNGGVQLPNLNFHPKKWDEYETLKECRPYKSPVELPEDHDIPPLERMNQSVMLYVMNEKETNYGCQE